MRSAAEQGKEIPRWHQKTSSWDYMQEAARCGAHYINQRWLGGMLTNWTDIKTRVDRWHSRRSGGKAEQFDLLPKKSSMLRREMAKPRNTSRYQNDAPDVAVIVDQRREYNRKNVRNWGFRLCQCWTAELRPGFS